MSVVRFNSEDVFLLRLGADQLAEHTRKRLVDELGPRGCAANVATLRETLAEIAAVQRKLDALAQLIQRHEAASS